jgi:peptidylprolyl isomerase
MLSTRWISLLLISLLAFAMTGCGQPAAEGEAEDMPAAADMAGDETAADDTADDHSSDTDMGAEEDMAAEDDMGAEDDAAEEDSAMDDAGSEAVDAGDGDASSLCAGDPTLPTIDDSFIDLGDGLLSKDLVVGDGATVSAGTPIQAHYAGFLEDGRMFDSSCTRGAPFGVTVGTGSVIQGWDTGLQGMNVGGRRVLVIPAALGYGDGGVPQVGIGPGATLIFDVEVVSAQ